MRGNIAPGRGLGPRPFPVRPTPRGRRAVQGRFRGITPQSGPGDDDALLRRAGAGDLDAVAALVRRYQRGLYLAAVQIAGQDADARDIVQEVFLRVCRGAAGYRAEASVRSWLYRIAVNLALDTVRRRRDIPVASADLPPAPLDPGPEVEVERRELMRSVRRAVADLPPHYRAVVLLREFHDLSYEEIAAVLRIPVGTVRSRLHQARARLRAALDSNPEARGGIPGSC